MIWITGARGLIGNELLRAAPASARVWGIARGEAAGNAAPSCAALDLADFAAVERFFRETKPAAIIHCAATSRSPDCQANPQAARLANVEVTRFLAELATDIPFYFFSTDLVFDGRRGNYSEEDAPNPLSVYAETKVEAEAVVRRNPRHTIIRTSLNGGVSPTGNRGFNEELRLAWQAGRPTRLFVDEFRCPIPAKVTARAIWELVGRGATGVYHLAGAQKLSRFEIGELVAARWPALKPKLEAASLRDYTGAPRPPDVSLKCARAQALLSFRLPGLADWLAAHPDEVF